ncbi:MAG: pitrilysin family protein [bacterium]
MYKKYKTKSGLTVILSPRNETETVTLSLLCSAGSRHENKINNGISHFIEHLIFKGTEKRPSSLDISKELDGIGAVFNAYTSKDHTNFYIKAASEKIELAFDVLSDMLMNSKFAQDDIEKEKGVILEEMKMYEDNPTMYLEDVFENLIFENHELGRHIIGTRETVLKTDRKLIMQYLSELYVPNNMVLVLAGKFSSQKARKLIDKYFSVSRRIKSGGKKISLKKFVEKQTKPKIFLMNKKTEQVHVAIGFLGYNYGHKDLMALYVLAVVLGGNMSSRLFINIREKLGLCYFIKADLNIYQDTGNLMIHAGLDKSRIKMAIPLIIKELERIKDEGITKEELKLAQDFLAGHLVIQMEDSENIANYFGRQEILTGKIIEPKERIEKIKRVSLDDVNRVAKDIIKKEKINLAVIGPFEDKGVFERLIK